MSLLLLLLFGRFSRVQFCVTVDCSLPGSSVQEILQARILEWVAVPSSRDLPDPGVEPGSPVLQADSLPSELPEAAANKLSDTVSLVPPRTVRR